MKKLIVALALLGLVANSYAAKPEWAGDKEQKKAQKMQMKESKKAQTTATEERALVSENESILDDIFSSDERDIIKDYYNENASSETGKYKGQKKELPQGLRKKLERGGELPPGWQKKVARGEVLDNELREQSSSLPDSLLSRLPAESAATEIIKLKDKVIRVSKGEGTIVDIIDLADILMKN